MKKKKIVKLLKDVFCFEFVCTLFFMIVTYIMVMKHELWFDEVQAWVIPKYLDIGDVINQMKYEGHSAMWSLFLKLFIKCGFNFVILNFISWFIGVLSAILICYKTNFNRLMKILVLFNVSLLYYSTVFARPYCVAFLMMVLLMIFYKKRYNRPYLVGLILLILSNTHLMVMGFLLSLFLIEFYGFFKDKDNKKERIILMLFMVIGVLLFFFQVVGAFIVRESVFNGIPFIEMFCNFMETVKCFLDAVFNWPIMMFLGITFLILIFVKFYKYKKYFLILIITFLGYFLISLFYSLNSYKSFFLIVVVIFCIEEVITEYNDKILLKYLMLFLCCSLPHSIFVINDEYNKKVSDSLFLWKHVENKNNSNFLTFTKNAGFILYCEECKYINYFDGKPYKFSNFVDFGLNVFDYDKFNDLLIRNNIDFVIVDANTEKIIKEDLDYLESKKRVITKIYDADINNCASLKTTHCEMFYLYKVNRGALNHVK